MDLETMPGYLQAVENNPRAAWDGTMEAIQEDLATTNQQLWYDNDTGEFFIGPLAEEEED